MHFWVVLASCACKQNKHNSDTTENNYPDRVEYYTTHTHTHEERIRKYNHDINEIMSNIPVSKHQHHINDDLCPMIFGQINLDQNITSISQLSTG